MSLSQLTSRQREVFEFVRDLITNRGYGPTVREIGDNFGISSPNSFSSSFKTNDFRSKVRCICWQRKQF